MIVAIPTLILIFRSMKHYYDRQKYLTAWCHPLELQNNNQPPVVVLPLLRWNQMASRAMCFGARLSSDLIAVHLSDLDGDPTEEDTIELRRLWAKLVHEPAESAGMTPPPKLHVIHSRFWQFLDPLGALRPPPRAGISRADCRGRDSGIGPQRLGTLDVAQPASRSAEIGPDATLRIARCRGHDALPPARPSAGCRFDNRRCNRRRSQTPAEWRRTKTKRLAFLELLQLIRQCILCSLGFGAQMVVLLPGLATRRSQDGHGRDNLDSCSGKSL